MAGKFQHILPTFLLKGFESHREGEKIFTWLYPRNQEPIDASIRKVAAEKYFYGKQGELCVDDDITDFENEYAPLLDELRGYAERTEIYDHRVPHLITHLITRTKHIREIFRDLSEVILARLSEFFSDFNNIEAMVLGKYGKAEMEKKFGEIEGSRSYRRKCKKLIKRKLPELLRTQKNEMLTYYQNTFKNIKNGLPQIIKQEHIKGLLKQLIPSPRLEDYQKLTWIILYTEKSIILGDMGCLSETMKTDTFKVLTFKDDIIKNIFLPISDNKLLMGTSLAELPDLDINLLLERIAKHSREFFISSKKSNELSSMVSLIGSEKQLLNKEDVDQMAKEIFSEYTS